MLDEDFDYDDYEEIVEKKPFKERLRNFFFGVVILALVAVVAAALISRHMEQTKSYGRIVAAGELYEAPIYETRYQAITYESLHPELSKNKEVEKAVETATEAKSQQEEKAEASEKARENIIKLSSSKDSVREMTKQRAEKYKINEISTEDAVTIGPTTGPSGRSRHTVHVFSAVTNLTVSRPAAPWFRQIIRLPDRRNSPLVQS